MKNIKKFSSEVAYKAYKGTDGWGYPSVCFVEENEESQVYYNNEFIMRWYDNDAAKVPEFRGDISWSDFKTWVDGACRICELEKGEDPYTLTYYSNASDVTNKTNPDFLQLVELKNVNVGLFQNSKEGWKEVRFNFDLGCPEGFHKWFAHPYWNHDLGAFTKLWGRYDIIHNADGTTVDVTTGRAQSDTYDDSTKYWSANLMLQKIKATKNAYWSGNDNISLLESTYWENLVLQYIFSAYFKTFNTQSVYGGLQSNYQSNSTTWVKGQTDSITTHYGELGANMGYKFMHIENAVHGCQWIWGAGWLGNASINPTSYYMTFDDEKANIAVNLSRQYADVTGYFAYNQTAGYITKMDLYGVPTAAGGSSSTGFYDGMWSYNLYDNRIAYLGGSSNAGLGCGCWARGFDHDVSYAGWALRGRLTLNR